MIYIVDDLEEPCDVTKLMEGCNNPMTPLVLVVGTTENSTPSQADLISSKTATGETVQFPKSTSVLASITAENNSCITWRIGEV